MASRRKPAAAKAAASPAPEAQVSPAAESVVVTEAEAKAAEVEAAQVVTAEAGQQASAPASEKPKAAEPEATVVWPQRYRLTNNTRMPLHLPASYLVVEPFGRSTEFDAASGDFLMNLRCEIDAIASLNGLDKSVFVLEPIDQTRGE